MSASSFPEGLNSDIDLDALIKSVKGASSNKYKIIFITVIPYYSNIYYTLNYR